VPAARLNDTVSDLMDRPVIGVEGADDSAPHNTLTDGGRRARELKGRENEGAADVRAARCGGERRRGRSQGTTLGRSSDSAFRASGQQRSGGNDA
jgi:hypothetical protein